MIPRPTCPPRSLPFYPIRQSDRQKDELTDVNRECNFTYVYGGSDRMAPLDSRLLWFPTLMDGRADKPMVRWTDEQTNGRTEGDFI